jgi:hypothetical protein
VQSWFFGALLVLPGQLLSTAELPPETFMQQLRSGLPCVAPLQRPEPRPSSPLQALMEAEAPVLALAYRGPYMVHKKGDKVFIVLYVWAPILQPCLLTGLSHTLAGIQLRNSPPRRRRPLGRIPGSLL